MQPPFPADEQDHRDTLSRFEAFQADIFTIEESDTETEETEEVTSSDEDAWDSSW